MNNYLKFLEELRQKQVGTIWRLTFVPTLTLRWLQVNSGAMASQLFSTAVISGSKSLPNLVADEKHNSEYRGEGGTLVELPTIHRF